ncbi:Crinkler (CRN) family protein [Phytophthora palmivora]|uniref:Crinkler (CRN) family protein n=1 Tax=Phytophthora palmivora TaxID=4796 RepID=A0A2P4WY57_9STRA|nr:Crinkler (CRN) family protein [Phytophthora palmivora]
MPSTTVLNEPKNYEEECISLTEWTVDAVHDIPLIWRFMSDLGGCTSNGKVIWRLEDKQIASILVDGRFRDSTPDNKKSIVMGSPGIGKSTLLCVMAFYFVFQYKKNVLVYRQLYKFEQRNCLFYVGYEDGKVVQFAVQRCKSPIVINIYRERIYQQGISNAWLLLDGFFRYQDIPVGVRTFEMLATSQLVDLKSGERTDVYCCLLPCWSKKDLWSMGSRIYKFATEDMEECFYYSGGSVREFTLAILEDIRNAIDGATSGVDDVSIHSSVLTGKSQVDQLRHTFVTDANDTNPFIARL